ncbi:MAG TPA: VWA domain-containing protein [Gaiellaceae bacterium]|nr:VWA domain-containing protein [Gaiellaceae bacterium]
MHLSFLTPLAGLVAFAVILPLVAFTRTEQRVERARSLLRLVSPPSSRRITIAALVAIAALVGVGAAQPVIEERIERPARTDAQIFFVFDTSRSMLATQAPSKPNRFDRARAAALRMRAELGDAPVGVASFTDRVLPHLFPSTNEKSFDGVLKDSIGIERPPSDSLNNKVATSLASLEAVASGNFFQGPGRRLLVVFTDAETSNVGGPALKRAFAQDRIKVILVRFWADGERIFRPDGGLERRYIPDPSSASSAQEFARLLGGQTFDENQIDPAAAAAKAVLGNKEAVRTVEAVKIRPLSPFLFLAALMPLSLLLWRRNLA